MVKSLEDKLIAKRAVLVSRTTAVLGVSEDEAIDLLAIIRGQSLRINPLKAGVKCLQELAELGWSGMPVAWCPDGYTVDTGLTAIRDSQLVTDGQVYIQNAASWLPVIALNPQAGESVLDVCAAPGGKTSHIAALTGNQAHITANDNSRPRLAKLRANLDRMGVTDVRYTLYDATQIAQKLDGQLFDKILLDAPCSGEGMMEYGRDKDFATWSVAHIRRLQQLQKKILMQSWQLLKPGGTLVYSTCTMAPEENEAVVDYLLRKQPDAQVQPITFDLENRVAPVLSWNNKSYDPRLADALRLRPSPAVEAFFVCKLHKTARIDSYMVQ